MKLLALAIWAFSAFADIGHYNLQEGVALKGYDPVSYFPEGGGVPRVGTLPVTFEGVVYRFADAENARLFGTDPAKYAPTYGGWCAYAMASGSQVDIDPMIYTLHGRRLHFFVSHRAKRNFDADVMGFETNADRYWKQISGEDPR